MLELKVEEFLGQTTTAASVRPPLLPLNDEGYTAVIASDGIDLKSFKYKQGDRAGQTGYRMTVKWEIMDEAIKAFCKEKNRLPYITQSIMLNITPEGALAAENPGLKALREAVNQNTDGQPWSPSMLIGQVAKIRLNNRIDDKGDQQEEVGQVTKA